MELLLPVLIMLVELLLSVAVRTLVYTYGVPILRPASAEAEPKPRVGEMVPWSLLFGGLAHVCIVMRGIPLIGLVGSIAWLGYLGLFLYVFAFRWKVGVQGALKLAGVEVLVLFLLRLVFFFL